MKAYGFMNPRYNIAKDFILNISNKQISATVLIMHTYRKIKVKNNLTI